MEEAFLALPVSLTSVRSWVCAHHCQGGAASRVIGLQSNLSINLAFFLSCFPLHVVFLLSGWKQLLAALTY